MHIYLMSLQAHIILIYARLLFSLYLYLKFSEPSAIAIHLWTKNKVLFMASDNQNDVKLAGCHVAEQ